MASMPQSTQQQSTYSLGLGVDAPLITTVTTADSSQTSSSSSGGSGVGSGESSSSASASSSSSSAQLALVLGGALVGTAVSLACSAYFFARLVTARLETLEAQAKNAKETAAAAAAAAAQQQRAQRDAADGRRRRSLRNPDQLDNVSSGAPPKSNPPAPELLHNLAPADLPPHPNAGHHHHHKARGTGTTAQSRKYRREGGDYAGNGASYDATGSGAVTPLRAGTPTEQLPLASSLGSDAAKRNVIDEAMRNMITSSPRNPRSLIIGENEGVSSEDNANDIYGDDPGLMTDDGMMSRNSSFMQPSSDQPLSRVSSRTEGRQQRSPRSRSALFQSLHDSMDDRGEDSDRDRDAPLLAAPPGGARITPRKSEPGQAKHLSRTKTGPMDIASKPPSSSGLAPLGSLSAADRALGNLIEHPVKVYQDIGKSVEPDNVQYTCVPVPSATETGLSDSHEYDEVCYHLKKCLKLREDYVFVPRKQQERDAMVNRGMQTPMPIEKDVAKPSQTDRFRNVFAPEPIWRDIDNALARAVATGDKNPNLPVDPMATPHTFVCVDGVFRVFKDVAHQQQGEELFHVHSAYDFFSDLHYILKTVSSGPAKTWCHRRLMLLEQRFHLHTMLNAEHEFVSQKLAPHRDFYNVRKVDTHIHHSSCMNQKHLLRFIKFKLKTEPNEVVINREGDDLTLSQVFDSLNLNGYDLNVDMLDMHADKNTFHRFDKFNLKYNPCGQSRLREIFLKHDNYQRGRYMAEVTREVFDDLQFSKYQHAEYRISIYGRKPSEWDTLSSWVVEHKLYSDNVMWMIQIPRLYNIYREQGLLDSFGQMIDNIFRPLFEVSVDPKSHRNLHMFLRQVTAFDIVDDESKPERRPTKNMRAPEDWDEEINPPYSYYAYYVYANLMVLNRLRESKGLSTFDFRPHAGEAGDVDHLAATFLCAHNISHGINLRKSPGLQYLYYLSQIGLALSPLSNNSLFLDYSKNPFPVFFSRGLNVSISTDDPLQIHMTKEPLVEEYSIAAQVWKLTSCDLCEVARNSVLQSGFPDACKAHWISNSYFMPGPIGNDIYKTNVPKIRISFRQETLDGEHEVIRMGVNAHIARHAPKLTAAPIAAYPSPGPGDDGDDSGDVTSGSMVDEEEQGGVIDGQQVTEEETEVETEEDVEEEVYGMGDVNDVGASPEASNNNNS